MLDLQQAIKDGNERISASDAKLLLKACTHTKAKIIAEVGSYDGGSSIILGDYAKAASGRLFCVEPHPTQRWADNIRKYGLQNMVHLIQLASPWIPVIHVPQSIDVLFIDGDHHTRYMLADYHFFYPFVRPGGIICFHDWRDDWQTKDETNSEVRRGVQIILETDKLEKFGNCKCEDLSTIAFIKPE